MATLIVETRPEPCPLRFSGDSSDLVWFLSFAAVEQFGSQHELSLATTVLRHKYKLRFRTLLRFAAADDDDTEELEHIWQPAAPLAETAAAVSAALSSGDRQLDGSTKDFPAVATLLAELEAMARWAGEREAEIRLTYRL